MKRERRCGQRLDPRGGVRSSPPQVVEALLSVAEVNKLLIRRNRIQMGLRQDKPYRCHQLGRGLRWEPQPSPVTKGQDEIQFGRAGLLRVGEERPHAVREVCRKGQPVLDRPPPLHSCHDGVQRANSKVAVSSQVPLNARYGNDSLCTHFCRHSSRGRLDNGSPESRRLRLRHDPMVCSPRRMSQGHPGTEPPTIEDPNCMQGCVVAESGIAAESGVAAPKCTHVAQRKPTDGPSVDQ